MFKRATMESFMRKQKPSHLPLSERLMAGINETAETLGLGRNSVYALIKAGKLKSVKNGSRNLVTTENIRALVQQEAA